MNDTQTAASPALGTTVGATGHVIVAAGLLHVDERPLFVILTRRDTRRGDVEWNCSYVNPAAVSEDGTVSYWDSGMYSGPDAAWERFARYCRSED